MRNLLACLLPLALIACSQAADETGAGKQKALDPAFLADNAVWRNERDQELRKPDGWTSLVGLHWLELKAHYLGSSPGSGIRLAVGPPKLGMIEQRDGRVFFTAEKGVALTLDGESLKGRVELRTDQDQSPSLVSFDDGKGMLGVIKRGQRFGNRLASRRRGPSDQPRQRARIIEQPALRRARIRIGEHCRDRVGQACADQRRAIVGLGQVGIGNRAARLTR
jgi:uncharacterized protein (DUF1684 family)